MPAAPVPARRQATSPAVLNPSPITVGGVHSQADDGSSHDAHPPAARRLLLGKPSAAAKHDNEVFMPMSPARVADETPTVAATRFALGASPKTATANRPGGLKKAKSILKMGGAAASGKPKRVTSFRFANTPAADAGAKTASAPGAGAASGAGEASGALPRTGSILKKGGLKKPKKSASFRFAGIDDEADGHGAGKAAAGLSRGVSFHNGNATGGEPPSIACLAPDADDTPRPAMTHNDDDDDDDDNGDTMTGEGRLARTAAGTSWSRLRRVASQRELFKVAGIVQYWQMYAKASAARKLWWRALRLVKGTDKVDPWQQYNLQLLPTEMAMQHTYDPRADAWIERRVLVKVQPDPFAHGAQREVCCPRLQLPPHIASLTPLCVLAWWYTAVLPSSQALCGRCQAIPGKEQSAHSRCRERDW